MPLTRYFFFFCQIDAYLNAKNWTDIFSDPRRIINLDETGVFLSPVREKELCKRGERHVQTVECANPRECITVLMGSNASGELTPPLSVFNYKRFPRAVIQTMPNEFKYTSTQRGWMTSASFLEYMSQTFSLWLDEMNIQRPVIVFVDGHSSHLSLELSLFCSENGIVLIALHPNATNIIQPMDVGLFAPFKRIYKKHRDDWSLRNGFHTDFHKEDFAPLLKTVVDEVMQNARTLPNAFRACVE